MKKPYVYKTSYRDNSVLGRWLVLFGNPLINAVAKAKGQLSLEDVEDLNLKDSDCDELIQKFKDGLALSEKKHPERDMYRHVRSSILEVFWKDWFYVAIVAIICECTGIYYSIFIMYMADFIRDESQHYTRGIWLVSLFLLMNLFVILTRNRYI